MVESCQHACISAATSAAFTLPSLAWIKKVNLFLGNSRGPEMSDLSVFKFSSNIFYQHKYRPQYACRGSPPATWIDVRGTTPCTSKYTSYKTHTNNHTHTHTSPPPASTYTSHTHISPYIHKLLLSPELQGARRCKRRTHFQGCCTHRHRCRFIPPP